MKENTTWKLLCLKNNFYTSSQSKDVIKRYLQSYLPNFTTSDNISHFTIASFLQLPIFISYRMFETFLTCNDQEVLSTGMLIDGLLCLFTGGIASRINLLLQFMDFKSSDMICKLDVGMMLNHLHFLCNFQQCNLDKLTKVIDNLFGSRNYFTVDEVKTLSMTSNADLIILLSFYFNQLSPFKQNVIEHYAKFALGRDIILSEPIEWESEIPPPSNELIDYLESQNGVEESEYLDLSIIECSASEELKKFEDEMLSMLQIEETRDESDFNTSDNKLRLPSSGNFEMYISNHLKKPHRLSLDTSGLLQNSSKSLKYRNSQKINLESTIPLVFAAHKSKSSQSLDPRSLFAFKSDKKANNPCTKSELETKCDNFFNQFNAHCLIKSKISKCRLIVVAGQMFIYKVTNSNMLNLKCILPLHYSIIEELENFKLNTEDIIHIKLIVSNGYQTISSSGFSDIFFSSMNEKERFVRMIKTVSKYRNIEDDYIIQSLIGKGHFGEVRLGVNKRTQENVAIKTLAKIEASHRQHDKYYEMHVNEIDIFNFLQKCPHPNIVKAISLYESLTQYHLIFEYLPGDNLYSLNHKFFHKKESIIKIFTQITSAVEFLHTNGIIHRDLKPDNILLVNNNKEELNAKVIDFGLSKIMSLNSYTSEPFGSICFTAPEIIAGDSYNHKIDVWSLGIMIYYLFFGWFPFDDSQDNIKTIMMKVIARKPIFKNIITTPNNCNIIKSLKMCLEYDPIERCSVSQIIPLMIG